MESEINKNLAHYLYRPRVAGLGHGHVSKAILTLYTYFLVSKENFFELGKNRSMYKNV